MILNSLEKIRLSEEESTWMRSPGQAWWLEAPTASKSSLSRHPFLSNDCLRDPEPEPLRKFPMPHRPWRPRIPGEPGLPGRATLETWTSRCHSDSVTVRVHPGSAPASARPQRQASAENSMPMSVDRPAPARKLWPWQAAVPGLPAECQQPDSPSASGFSRAGNLDFKWRRRRAPGGRRARRPSPDRRGCRGRAGLPPRLDVRLLAWAYAARWYRCCRPGASGLSQHQYIPCHWHRHCPAGYSQSQSYHFSPETGPRADERKIDGADIFDTEKVSAREVRRKVGRCLAPGGTVGARNKTSLLVTQKVVQWVCHCCLD